VQPASLPAAAPLPEREAVDADIFAREIAPSYRPVVLRGQVKDWPAVAAGRAGPRALADYLVRFAGGRPLETLIGAPEIGGRFFYDESVTGLNFRRQQVPLPQLLAELVKLAESGAERPHAIYANAAAAPEHLPGWQEANPLGLPQFGATPRLWIGNAAQVATHHDASPNLAVVVAGRRRFTLFPPDQIANLYIGPLDHTPAGPPTSMVDPDAPDLARYPRFAEAWPHAMAAELAPGDAIFIPSIWWHHVRALEPVNVLVNYWWNDRAPPAFAAMVHTMMAVRELPAAERAAWRGWFDHYAFGDEAPAAGDHLPEPARGILGPASAERTAKIRRYLQAMLGRG
jgi:hypothetical protein